MRIFTNLVRSIDSSLGAVANTAYLAERSTEVAVDAVDGWARIQSANLANDYEKALSKLPPEVRAKLEEQKPSEEEDKTDD